jgi:hypothetical protein
VLSLALPVPSVLLLSTGQPPKRLRKDGGENVNDLQSIIGRSLKSFASKSWSKKSSDNGRKASIDKLSPNGAEDKV